MLNPSNLTSEDIQASSLEALTLEFFAPAMRHQGRVSLDNPLEQISRGWQIYQDIPERHADQLRLRVGPQYLDIPGEFQRRLGLSPEDIYIVATAVLMGYTHKARHIAARLEQAPKELKDFERVEWLIDQFNATPEDLHLHFTQRELQTYLNHPDPDVARKWLAAFSATPYTVRTRMEMHRRYWAGELTYQILPLDATPVMRLSEGLFIVPDSQSLVAWMASLPELYVLHHWPSGDWARFRTTLGFIQEIYLKELAQTTLPGATLIGEHAYRRPEQGNQVQGPDLTILEPGTHSMVMIESKAVLFEDNARTGAGVEPFRVIDDRFSEVVVKADWKAADLLDSRVRTYDPYRTQLADVNPGRVITVIVHAEPLFAFDATWRARRHTSGHMLHGHVPNFLALSVEELGLFLEAARQSGRPLYDLLAEQVAKVEATSVGFPSSVTDRVDVKLAGSAQEEAIEQFLRRMDALKALRSQP